MYGGAKGGGKSDFLLAAPFEQIALADRKWRAMGQKQRGRAILFRKNLKNLDDLIRRSKELFWDLDPGMKRDTKNCGWFKLEKRWVFSSGYIFEFAHLDSPDDEQAYQGQEITAALFDQVEEIPFEVYNFIVGQIRTKDDDMRPMLMARCTANPGGRHAQWVKDYFCPHIPERHNRIVSDKIKLPSGREHETTKAFIPAKLSDNKYLYNDPAYESVLAKLPDHMRRMWLDGDWNVVIGAHFASVWDQSKHVRKSFPIPASWEIKGGMDWGTVAPACYLVGAKDNDGNVYIIDEIYGPGKTGRLFAERFKKVLTKQQWSNDRKWTADDFYGLLDYGAWREDGQDGPNAARSMQNAGMRLFKANKNRSAGMEQVMERLTSRSIVIFGDRCPNLVRTLPQLQTDPRDPNDVDTEGEDHAYDALRYLLIDWPAIGTTEEEKKSDRDVERWMELARKRQNIRDEESITGYA